MKLGSLGDSTSGIIQNKLKTFRLSGGKNQQKRITVQLANEENVRLGTMAQGIMPIGTLTREYWPQGIQAR